MGWLPTLRCPSLAVPSHPIFPSSYPHPYSPRESTLPTPLLLNIEVVAMCEAGPSGPGEGPPEGKGRLLCVAEPFGASETVPQRRAFSPTPDCLRPVPPAGGEGRRQGGPTVTRGEAAVRVPNTGWVHRPPRGVLPR